MRKSACVIWILLLAMTAIASDNSGKLSLQECVQMARQNHPAIQAAKWNSKALTYKRKSAFANFLPVFDAQYSHTWLDERPVMTIPAQAYTIPGGTQNITIDLSSIGMPPVTVPVTMSDMNISTPATNIPMGDREIDTLTLSVTQPLFTGGAIWQGYHLAKLNERMAGLQATMADEEIVYQTRMTFYGVLKAREFVRVSQKAVEMGESLQKRAKAFYDVGMIAKNDYLEAQVNVAQLKQNLTTAQTTYDLARTGLGLLIGRQEGDLPEVQGELAVSTTEIGLDDSIQNGLQERPDVRIAEIQSEMADRAVKLERASWAPQVALIGTYKHETGGTSTDEDSMALTLGAQWTFWEWGKKYYNVRSAKSTTRAATENLRFTRDKAIFEIKQAYIKIQQAKMNMITAQASLASAEENLRVVQARFDQQMATGFDVLKAQTLFTQAQTNLISARADYLTAMAELDRAMGYTPSVFETSQTVVAPATTEPPASVGSGNTTTPQEPPSSVEADDAEEPPGSVEDEGGNDEEPAGSE